MFSRGIASFFVHDKSYADFHLWCTWHDTKGTPQINTFVGLPRLVQCNSTLALEYCVACDPVDFHCACFNVCKWLLLKFHYWHVNYTKCQFGQILQGGEINHYELVVKHTFCHLLSKTREQVAECALYKKFIMMISSLRRICPNRHFGSFMHQ